MKKDCDPKQTATLVRKAEDKKPLLHKTKNYSYLRTCSNNFWQQSKQIHSTASCSNSPLAIIPFKMIHSKLMSLGGEMPITKNQVSQNILTQNYWWITHLCIAMHSMKGSGAMYSNGITKMIKYWSAKLSMISLRRTMYCCSFGCADGLRTLQHFVLSVRLARQPTNQR